MNNLKIGKLKGKKIEREFYGQGYIYKNEEAFNNKKGTCYIPELSDTRYSYKDFLNITGNEEQARILFEEVDWQHPETLFEEWEMVE